MKEIVKIRKIMSEKDREERKCIVINIVTQVRNKDTERGKARVREFLREKVGVNYKISGNNYKSGECRKQTEDNEK